MRILACNSFNDYQMPMIMAVCRLLKYLNHEVILWNPKEKPAFDLFHEFKPEHIFLERFTDEIDKCCKKYNVNIISIPQIVQDIGYFSDPFLYQPTSENNDLKCYKVSFVDDASQLTALDLSAGQEYRIFSKEFLDTEYYCGFVEEQYMSIIACNAYLVQCPNMLSLLNFSLSNPNSVYGYQKISNPLSRTVFNIGDYLGWFDSKVELERFINDMWSNHK